jgi:coenzyme PQQ synthesis protein D (PqqD)
MLEPLTPTTRIARTEGLVTEPMDGGIVMLDPAADRYLRLNATGRLIWEALAEPATVAELAQMLSERSGISRERAEADAATFIDGLIDFGAARPA